MFKKKATADQLNDMAGLMGTENRTLWEAVTQLQERFDVLEGNQSVFQGTLRRYAIRLTKIMVDLENFSTVVDHNAGQGEKANLAIQQLAGRTKDLKDAIILVAAQNGVKIDVLPEVPAAIIVQPGLPERLGLTKLSKAEQKQVLSTPLPEPVELSVDEMNRGLHLVR